MFFRFKKTLKTLTELAEWIKYHLNPLYIIKKIETMCWRFVTAKTDKMIAINCEGMREG